MRVFRWAAAGIAAAVLACAPSPGDCPTPDDCACPCTDKADIVCNQAGKQYLNQCMLECDGGELGACDGSNPDGWPQGTDVDCDANCGNDAYAPECGAVGAGADRRYVLFDNSCYLSCFGAQAAPDKKCE